MVDAGNITECDGTLKWFNRADNYGFITVTETGRDALLHNSCVTEEELVQLKKGAKIRFVCIDANGLLSVQKIISITEVEQVWCSASIKWFNEKTGFGFVLYADDLGVVHDIFIHATIAKKLGCQLVPGTKVQVVIVADGIGRMRADAIRLPK